MTWEPRAQIEARTAALLPGLFLARVDGKSPVEYITEDWQRDAVRRVAKRLLLQPVATLAEVRGRWDEQAAAFRDRHRYSTRSRLTPRELDSDA